MKKKKHTNKDLAEAHVFPSQLSRTDKIKAEKEFSKFVAKKRKDRKKGSK